MKVTSLDNGVCESSAVFIYNISTNLYKQYHSDITHVVVNYTTLYQQTTITT